MWKRDNLMSYVDPECSLGRVSRGQPAMWFYVAIGSISSNFEICYVTFQVNVYKHFTVVVAQCTTVLSITIYVYINIRYCYYKSGPLCNEGLWTFIQSSTPMFIYYLYVAIVDYIDTFKR